MKFKERISRLEQAMDLKDDGFNSLRSDLRDMGISEAEIESQIAAVKEDGWRSAQDIRDEFQWMLTGSGKLLPFEIQPYVEKREKELVARRGSSPPIGIFFGCRITDEEGEGVGHGAE